MELGKSDLNEEVTVLLELKVLFFAHLDGLFPLVGVGLVLLLHSFRSRATSRVTPTRVRHVFLHLLVPCLLGTSSSSGTWYCQLHHSAGDVVCISSLDLSKPTKTATAHNLVDRWNVWCVSNFLVSHVISSWHSEDPAKHPHLRGSNLPLVGPLVGHLHCPAFAPKVLFFALWKTI